MRGRAARVRPFNEVNPPHQRLRKIKFEHLWSTRVSQYIKLKGIKLMKEKTTQLVRLFSVILLIPLLGPVVTGCGTPKEKPHGLKNPCGWFV